MRVLVVNTGSSSVKLRAVEADDEVSFRAELDAPTGRFDAHQLDDAVRAAGPIDAVGHRVVHGGPRYRAAVAIDADVERELAGLVELAPLHQPAAVAAIAAVRTSHPDLPAVACFDTAFHATLPAAAATYPLPVAWRRRWGLRRFGFHGLSHAWAARRVADRCGANGDHRLRVVTCHLGAGGSLAAVLGGRSIDTTMGFTPLEGVVMANRSGSVDPGLLTWLLGDGRLSLDELVDGLSHGSGLTGLAGSAGMTEIVDRAAGGDDDARLAVDVYVHVLCRHVGAMAASLGGIDALAFTGGIGEHVPHVRAATAERLGWLGVAVDATANDRSTGDAELTAAGTAVRTFVVTAREELEIAGQVRRVLG